MHGRIQEGGVQKFTIKNCKVEDARIDVLDIARIVTTMYFTKVFAKPSPIDVYLAKDSFKCASEAIEKFNGTKGLGKKFRKEFNEKTGKKGVRIKIRSKPDNGLFGKALNVHWTTVNVVPW